MKKITASIIGAVLLFCIGSAGAQIKWQEEKSEHFIIYYKSAPADFVENVEQMAEQYYHEISDNLGITRYQNWTYDKRARIYIYDDQDDYVNSAQQARWSHGAASAKTREIRTFPSAHGFFDSVLPHELGHIIFREFVGFNINLPLWLDEGVAMYQEKAKRWGANKSVQEAIKKKTFIPLEELTYMSLTQNTPQDMVELFYAESASIVYFMISEMGDNSFARFCKKLQQESTFDNALSASYMRIHTLVELNKAWMNYLKEEK